MYVCKQCHDRDLDATRCNYSYDIHLGILYEADVLYQKCEICGKMARCIPCAEYTAEILTRAHIKRYAEIKKERSSNDSMC